MADVITHGETMNRLIHQAVRRDLGRFEAALDALAPGDRSRAAALGEAFAHFDTMLTHYHEGEEHDLWPVIGDPAAGARAASRASPTSTRTSWPGWPTPGPPSRG